MRRGMNEKKRRGEGIVREEEIDWEGYWERRRDRRLGRRRNGMLGKDRRREDAFPTETGEGGKI